MSEEFTFIIEKIELHFSQRVSGKFGACDDNIILRDPLMFA